MMKLGTNAIWPLDLSADLQDDQMTLRSQVNHKLFQSIVHNEAVELEWTS